MAALAITFLQLAAALWASILCAAIAFYGSGCHHAALGGGKKQKQKQKQQKKWKNAFAAAAPAAAATIAPAGSFRRLLSAALPGLVLLVVSPALFVDRRRAPLLVTPVLGQLSLTSFKLIAFALGRGPLAALSIGGTCSSSASASGPSPASPSPPPLPPLRALDFIAWAVAPVHPPSRLGVLPPPSVAEARALLRAALPQALSAAFAGFVAGSADGWGLPRPVKYWFYTLLLSQCVTCAWQLWRYAVASLPCPPFAQPLRTAPQFDRPWLSESLADYWGKRWNVATARALRALAYDPVAEGRLVARGQGGAAAAAAAAAPPPAGGSGNSDSPQLLVAAETTAEAASRGRAAAPPPAGSGGGDSDLPSPQPPPPPPQPPRPSPLRRFLGLQATFLLSGAWHALVLYPPNTGTWEGAWRWFLFFSVWAPALALEQAVKKAWMQRLRLPSPPRPARVVLTNALLIAVATPLFFGPCDTTGMCARMFENARAMVGLA